MPDQRDARLLEMVLQLLLERLELPFGLEILDDADRSETNKVEGCISQVWLKSQVEKNGSPRLHFTGDSDSAIVKGLVAILRVVYSGKTADEILAVDLESVFRDLGLEQHLSPNRRNGFFSMVEQIRREARILSELTP